MARINERGAFNAKHRFERAVAFEQRGALIDQTAAQALEERWLNVIRAAGSGSPPATWNYLGGDITDVINTPGGDDLAWIGADWFDGTTIANDAFVGTALPVRNGIFVEGTPGTFTGAIQLYQTGSSGVWLNAVAQGGLAAGTIWWPIAGLNDNGTFRVMCWHVDSAATSPYGTLLDSHIVTVNTFGGYVSHTATNLGSNGKFWIDGVFRDTTHTYIYGEEFRPSYDARRTDGNTDAANYAKDWPELQNHGTVKRVARVTNGQLTTVANWTFWDGASWVTGAGNATPMVDTDGVPIYGDAGVVKVATAHYLLASHQLTDGYVNVYKASEPRGPWGQIARVPAPGQGVIQVDGPVQIGQLTKFVPTATQAPPTGHRIVMLSRNQVPAVSAGNGLVGRNIRAYAPQFVVVPEN